MAGASNIEWTEQTWNPIVGCSIVSPGCTHCYAMKMAARIEAMNAGLRAKGKLALAPHYDGTTRRSKSRDQRVNGVNYSKSQGTPGWTGKLALAPDDVLLAPLRRKKPTTYFVNSMGDLFHEDVADEWIDRVFAVMALCPEHTFQVLTKRAERMREYCAERPIGLSTHVLDMAPRDKHGYPVAGPCTWPLPNVWLGVSTERQKEADERIPHLLQMPAAVRFISAEPLLGPISLRWAAWDDWKGSDGGQRRSVDHLDGARMLDWVIVGGESGPGARSMHPEWARDLRDQCAAAGVAFFFKQWGEWAPSTPEAATGNPRSGWCALSGNKPAKAPELYENAGGAFVERVGKKAAGRLLDGVQHNGMPEVRR